ncbi:MULTISPECIES: hypothetical protein [unclassified Streptomyces]|uniref:hypothetical protein n=1 Tax=unclassified Streptomyces TaxID=2593676 RepID=UPI0008048D77|nr:MULTISPECIES: hypothetical protein [unclassified Streptomyces]SBU99998.1 hypothetical protein YUMDRAFT_06299 [Streptomyces sp. OspMP-M45]
MSKPNRKRYKMSEVKAQMEEAVGGNVVEFETDKGDVLTFPHPLFTDDDWDEKVDAAENSRAKAIAILGDEQYEKYHAAGHADGDIGLLMLAVQQDMQGQIKRRPTR